MYTVTVNAFSGSIIGQSAMLNITTDPEVDGGTSDENRGVTIVIGVLVVALLGAIAVVVATIHIRKKVHEKA